MEITRGIWLITYRRLTLKPRRNQALPRWAKEGWWNVGTDKGQKNFLGVIQIPISIGTLDFPLFPQLMRNSFRQLFF
jgi:hypothetical protein